MTARPGRTPSSRDGWARYGGRYSTIYSSSAGYRRCLGASGLFIDTILTKNGVVNRPGKTGVELRRANEILKSASAFFAAELDGRHPR